MPLMKEIALKCGVSVSTVSKALNNRKDVSAKTKEHILRVTEEMGYVANVMARSLRTNRTHNIGIILDNIDQSFSHEFFSNVLESFKKETEKRGYDITFINREFAGNKISYKAHCDYRNFDGVVVIYTDFESKEILELINSSFPVVTIDRVFDNCSTISSDNTAGMFALVEYAIKMGHKKIAYIHGENTQVTRDRLAGFYAAMYKNNIEVKKEYLKESVYRDAALTNEMTKELLALSEPPTCIIFPDDHASFLSIKTIDELQADVSYMGYDGINLAREIGLTTYDQDRSRLGQLAAIKLIDRIENPETLVEHTVIYGKVCEGKTVKRIDD